MKEINKAEGTCNKCVKTLKRKVLPNKVWQDHLCVYPQSDKTLIIASRFLKCLP